jgi:biotin carboxyl carrier protein
MLSPSPVKDVVSLPHRPRDLAAKSRKSHATIRKLVLWSVVSIALLAMGSALIVLPIRFPSVVSSYADISAAHQWTVERGPTGQLITHTVDYRTGMSGSFHASNFEAGSSISFSLSPWLRPGQRVRAGDTLGTASSSQMQERLVSLQGQLATAEGALAVNAAGSKSAVVEAAQQRLQSAKRRREDYQPTVERTQSLFEQQLVPPNEYDRVMSAAHTMDDAIAINQADVAAAQSGAKPEELALAQARIASLKNEIAATNQQAAGYTIIAPMNGTLWSNPSGSTLLTISDPAQYVALVPIRWSDYARVAATPEARVMIAGFSRPVQGRIVALEHEVSTHGAQRVVMATALLDAPPKDLLPGSVARCKVVCSPMTAVEYGRFVLHSIATSVEGAPN